MLSRYRFFIKKINEEHGTLKNYKEEHPMVYDLKVINEGEGAVHKNVDQYLISVKV